jgi:hypothetical protein
MWGAVKLTRGDAMSCRLCTRRGDMLAEEDDACAARAMAAALWPALSALSEGINEVGAEEAPEADVARGGRWVRRGGGAS